MVPEKAGEEASVRGETRTGAGAAERAGDGGDDADEGTGLGSVVGGDLSGVGRSDGSEVEWVENLEDTLGADDFGKAPTVGVSYVHVFDEPHMEAWAIELKCNGEDFVLVHRLSNNGIDFNWGESEVSRGFNAS